MTAEAPIPISLTGNITTLPLDHPIRRNVDRVLESVSYWDRACSSIRYRHLAPTDYDINRGGLRYFELFQGLAEMFSYVRRLESNRVLDIGAGTTRGIYELSRTTFAEGLIFEATVLEPVEQIEGYLGLSNVHVTSAEYLEGINDNSVGGVVAMVSIVYSPAPKFAIRRIDEVLVPGGVIKATFPSTVSYSVMRTHFAFTAELQRLGYDIAIVPVIGGDWDLVMAIKSGGERPMSAEELLRKDQESVDQYNRELWQQNL